MASIQKRNTKDDISSYRVQVRLKGHPPESASFERLVDAKKWAQNTESAIREGRHFKTSISKRHTMGDAIDRYYKENLSLRKNPKNQKTYLSYWRDVLGAYSLADINAALIVKHRNALLGAKNKYGRTVGAATANRYTQALGHVLSVAMNEWEWTIQNPMTKLKKYKEPRGRVRFLSDVERGALLLACKESENAHLYKAVVLALSTGARKMEILGLKWTDVDFSRGVIVLDETKNGERRVIPLQGLAMELMRDHAKNKVLGCDFVFPSPKTKRDKTGKRIFQPIDVRTPWGKALSKAKLVDFRFHDLRHSAASYLAMNGATLAEIAEVLGHKTLQMVKRYAHLSEAHTSGVVARMNERIFEVEEYNFVPNYDAWLNKKDLSKNQMVCLMMGLNPDDVERCEGIKTKTNRSDDEKSWLSKFEIYCCKLNASLANDYRHNSLFLKSETKDKIFQEAYENLLINGMPHHFLLKNKLINPRKDLEVYKDHTIFQIKNDDGGRV